MRVPNAAAAAVCRHGRIGPAPARNSVWCVVTTTWRLLLALELRASKLLLDEYYEGFIRRVSSFGSSFELENSSLESQISPSRHGACSLVFATWFLDEFRHSSAQGGSRCFLCSFSIDSDPLRLSPTNSTL